MLKLIAIIGLCAASSAVLAHEDRVLPIGPDGVLGVLPSTFGPVKVLIGHSLSEPRSVNSVVVASPQFTVSLSPCVLAKLRTVAHVRASGSWYHDLSKMPPYISLTFFTGDSYDPGSYTSEFYSVTFSLTDGRILSGQKAWDPWWGQWHADRIEPASKCSGWYSTGLWPNNSFKPNLLRYTVNMAG